MRTTRPIPLLGGALLGGPLLCGALLAACATAPPAPAPTTVGPRADQAELARLLAGFVEHERTDKEIPAISLALVDGGEIVWARGFGWADREETRPADADTVYRAGSITKLLTAIAVMQLVERGELDLDAPLEDALPGFSIEDPYPLPITLRQILAHRSGLVREPPVGSYFDPDEPTLAATVASLAQTRPVYPPGARTKYSNAAVSVAGYAVERAVGRPFAEHVRAAVLSPCGMESSAFERDRVPSDRIADALMWTRDGREFEAPTFELGIGPAGSLYASVSDLARFASMLLADGEGERGRVLAPGTLAAMWEPRWPDGAGAGFGVGFAVGELDGRRTVGHNGAVYGFATSLIALPEEGLGVAVACSRDVSNAVADRIARLALRGMLAVRAGTPLPEPEVTEPLHPWRVKRLVGTWHSDELLVTLERPVDELRLSSTIGDFALRVRGEKGEPVVDDPLAYGSRLALVGDGLVYAGKTLARIEPMLPAPCPARWRGLIGEYGWDHDTLYVLEDRGELVCLIEWFFRYPIDEAGDEAGDQAGDEAGDQAGDQAGQEVGEDRFRFPDRGLYHGEELVFERDASGRATAVVAAGVRFERRAVGAEEGATFRIEPQHGRAELVRMAAAASPPRERGKRAPELVDLRALDAGPDDAGLRFDVRYATTNNFLGLALYDAPHAYLQRPAAEALVSAHRWLAGEGYGLLIHDAFRPWRVTKMFWDATPTELRAFVADPSEGSRHNRGCAVDLTLYDVATGEPVEMVSGYDEFSPRSSPTYPGGTARQRFLRDLLRRAMEAEGFRVYPNEWWHFDFEDWRAYPILEEFPE